MVADARAQTGLAADVEAQLARAVADRLLEARASAQARVGSTGAALSTAIGAHPAQGSLRVEGELVPLEVPAVQGSASAAPERRPEVVTALAEADAQKRRIELFERLRIPNPTISVFAKNDWINERLIGVGVSIPIPIPGPIRRTYAGEIAEASALAARAETDVLKHTRRVGLALLLLVVACKAKPQEPPKAVREDGIDVELSRASPRAGRHRRAPHRDIPLSRPVRLLWQVEKPTGTDPQACYARPAAGARLMDDGRLNELLLELRVLLQGAQMLTTFLIILPFNAGFAKLNGFERGIYIATFVCSLAAVVLFTAPAAHHRLTRPLRDREVFKTFASRIILAGAGALSVAWTLATKLVVTEVAGSATGTAVAAAVAIAIVVGWWGVPLVYRRRWERAPVGAAPKEGHNQGTE